MTRPRTRCGGSPELAGLAERTAEAEKLLGNAAGRCAARAKAAEPRPAPGSGGRAAAGPAAPGGQRPDRAARRDRRIAAQTRQRLSGTPGRRHPPSEPARRRRPPDRQGSARPAGGVRVQGPARGQRRRCRGRSHRRARQSRRRAAARTRRRRVIRRTGRPPRTVTADRGYGEAAVENDLHELGVRTVVIPRKGKPGKARRAHEHRPAFRRTVKWRTGSEARISTLKRQYGWDRSRLDHLDGARIVDRTGRHGAQPGQDRGDGRLISPTGEINRPLDPSATTRARDRPSSSGRSSYVGRMLSTRRFRPFSAVSMITFSALRRSMPIIGMLRSTARV